MALTKSGKWTNPSVLKFAGGADPVEAITERARRIVARALDEGWSGPPFDPLWLADHLKLEVIPREDVGDARTVPLGKSRLRVEYNPNRPHGRLRFSLAHEISHSLFEDCGERVRNRSAHEGLTGNDWELEALCNIAAAEFLMPFGVLSSLSLPDLSVDHLMGLRKKFDVSTEALFIRTCEVTDEPCAVFCASRAPARGAEVRLRVDYALGSTAWPYATPRGVSIPVDSVVSECSGIGFTAKGDETWGDRHFHVECVGIPPYPGMPYPRVVGVLTHKDNTRAFQNRIAHLRGDALAPRGAGRKLIVHAVNDATVNWGGKFAQALRRKWPEAQNDFRTWASTPNAMKLGNVRFYQVERDIYVATGIAQKGYGPSAKPRIRYSALRECFSKIAAFGEQEHLDIHMPQVGCGEGRGTWEVVQELIASAITKVGLKVTVYVLPNSELSTPPSGQQFLPLSP